MAAPTNLDEYFDKSREHVRDRILTIRNQSEDLSEVFDVLTGMTKSDLEALGLTTAKADRELARLAVAREIKALYRKIKTKLTEFNDLGT